MRRLRVLLVSLVLLATPSLLAIPAAAFAPANPSFERTWERTDKPVADGAISRTWMWGPEAFTGAIQEPYAESPGELRAVQYYDKSRMEITQPNADPTSIWYVTNGLLVVELMSGRMQIGDSSFTDRAPAAVNVAGDPDDPLTYAVLATLRDAPALPDGALVTQMIAATGAVSDAPETAGYNATAANHVTAPGIDHQVASPFWNFMTSSGTVYENGGYTTAPLFENPYYATGLPIIEPYWAYVKVGGVLRLVLLQCFERRCLTYTPDNPEGWQVEAGNVGQHYYRWRTAEAGAAQVTLAGASEHGFNATDSELRFDINGTTLANDPAAVYVWINDFLYTDFSVQISGNSIALPFAFFDADERNEVILLARDVGDNEIYAEFAFWTGDEVLDVAVLDESGQPANGALVTALLGDDQSVSAQATAVDGVARFESLPDRTIIFDATASGNRFGSLATTGGAGSAEIHLKGFDAPSPIDNNDLSQGLDGWNVGDAAVSLVPHQESGLPELPGFPAGLQPAQADDMDLILYTNAVEGPQTIARTFDVEPGANEVAVRYRFVTSEVPGGYFGTEFNDYFNVSIRSQAGGGSVSESNSMNGLGLGAFDAEGATAWRETTLPLSVDGDTIQVDITVANVSDDLLDSYVIVDFIDEKPLAITALQLNDIDNSALTFLSASAHPWFGGNTHVHGTITIEGDDEDTLDTVELEVLEGGTVIATGQLADAVRGTLIQQFGDDEKVEISGTQLLFEIPAGELAGANQTTNGNLSLRVKARTQDGDEATREFGQVQKLVRHAFGGTRYFCCNEGEGGDEWLKPSVAGVVNGMTGFLLGDSSNMNGGNIEPHGSHRTGNDIDGDFTGIENMNAAVANTLIDIVNSGDASRVTIVGVTFTQAGDPAFWNVISTTTLEDGRLASTVFVNWAGHRTHFHMRFSD